MLTWIAILCLHTVFGHGKEIEQRAKLLLQYRQKKSVSSLNVLLINWRRVLTESVRKVSRIIFSVR